MSLLQNREICICYLWFWLDNSSRWWKATNTVTLKFFWGTKFMPFQQLPTTPRLNKTDKKTGSVIQKYMNYSNKINDFKTFIRDCQEVETRCKEVHCWLEEGNLYPAFDKSFTFHPFQGGEIALQIYGYRYPRNCFLSKRKFCIINGPR